MSDLFSFVVKVYRVRGRAMVGTVQEVRSGRTIPFRTKDELWNTLHSPLSRSAEAAQPHRRSASGAATGVPSRPKTMERKQEK